MLVNILYIEMCSEEVIDIQDITSCLCRTFTLFTIDIRIFLSGTLEESTLYSETVNRMKTVLFNSYSIYLSWQMNQIHYFINVIVRYYPDIMQNKALHFQPSLYCICSWLYNCQLTTLPFLSMTEFITVHRTKRGETRFISLLYCITWYCTGSCLYQGSVYILHVAKSQCHEYASLIVSL